MTVFVGPSIWREINVLTATRMMVAMNSAPYVEKVIWAPLWNDALIGRSRSIMCTEFLKTDADVMIIIDDDIIFEVADFWKIVEGARATRSIYGGAYVTRSTEPHLTSRVFPNTTVRFEAGPVRRPIEIQYLATGFFAIHRDLMESMIGAEFQDADGTHRLEECQLGADRPFVPFFSPFQVREEDGRRHYLSEDWAYCNRARQLGFKVWMDESIILQHMGLYPYTVADLNNPGHAFPSRGIEWTEAHTAPTPFGLDLLDNLTADIAEWAEEDFGDTRRMIEVAQELSGFLWKTKPQHQTEREWYQREDVGMAYVGDLANWHLRGHLPTLAALDGIEGKRLLDYGAGIGTFALLAAQRGARVTAFEPNPVMREFMTWRALKYGLGIEILSDAPRGDGTYDVVTCWHVFEHLPNPEVTLERLLDLMVPDGLFVTESGFDDHDTPQHHRHEDWSAVIARSLVTTKDYGIYQRPGESGAPADAGARPASASAAPSSSELMESFA